MSHVNGFYVKGRWGQYYSIQTNTRDGDKVVTHHIKYVGKNKPFLRAIKNLQYKDKELIRSLPLELITDPNGEQIISPKTLQEMLLEKADGMGVIDSRTERWFRKWAGKKDDEELTDDDLQELFKDDIIKEDYTTQCVLKLTTKEGKQYFKNLKELEKLEAEAKKKADKFRATEGENDEGETMSLNSVNNEIKFDEDEDIARKKTKELEAELPIKYNVLKQYQQINDILMNDPSKFENEDENSDWYFIMQKAHGAEIIEDMNLGKDEIDLIEKYFKLYGTETKVRKLDTAVKETEEMTNLRAEIKNYENETAEERNYLVNLALNGKLNDLRVNMNMNYDHRHYKQDLACIFADTKEVQVLKLVKQLTKDKLEADDIMKLRQVRDNLEMNTFEEIKNVYNSHFMYKFGLEFVDSKGKKQIRINDYEKGRPRKFAEELVKSGFALKQFNRDGERETTYTVNVIDATSKSKTSMLRKACFDVDNIQKEAKELANIKLKIDQEGEKNFDEKLKKETERQQQKLMKEFETKAHEHVKELEKIYGNKFTKQKYSQSLARAKNKIIKQFKEEFKEKKINETTKKRLEKQFEGKKINPESKEYKEEYQKVKKWYEKKLKIESKKEEYNLMRKYTLSKRRVGEILTESNLDYVENVHKSNISSFEKKVKEEEKKTGRDLSYEEKGKLFFRQNIHKMYDKLVKESKEINKVRNIKSKTPEQEELARKKTMYERNIKNKQEFAYLLKLVSMDKGSVLEGVRAGMGIFDYSDIFNSRGNSKIEAIRLKS